MRKLCATLPLFALLTACMSPGPRSAPAVDNAMLSEAVRVPADYVFYGGRDAARMSAW